MLTLGIVGFVLLWVWLSKMPCSGLGLSSEPIGSERNRCGLPGPNAAFEGFSCASVMYCCPVCQPQDSRIRDCLTADWSSLQFCTGSYCWAIGGCFLTDSWFVGYCCSPSLALILTSAEKSYRAATMLIECITKQYGIEEVQLLTSVIIHFIEELRNQTKFPKPSKDGVLSDHIYDWQQCQTE